MKLKPYMLVSLSMDDGRYNVIVEVMSFPIPHQHFPQTPRTSDTIMVRMVPGHPGTLKEVFVDRIKGVAKSVRWISYAVVKGVGGFPVDMLRYDNAVPVNFKVVEDYPYYEVDADKWEGSHELIVATVLHGGVRNDFEDARWKSFLWEVKRIKREQVKS